MCGITGLVVAEGAPPPHESLLHAMCRPLRARGPDAGGVLVRGRAGLGHRRLSIIDLAGGTQPMSTPDGRHHIVYNGEVYNFAELRRELQGRGRTFETSSDTEVVLHSYAEWGAGCLQRFQGMFAFAILDEAERRLFLARDGFGQKPLYWCVHDGGFTFGSELKALLANPAVPRELSRENLARYLAYDYVPEPHSILRSIMKLPAGHYLELPLDSPDAPEVHSWWRPTLEGERLDISLADASERFGKLFEKAVERRLVADVPLGVLLSGGIDSSAVVAMMRRLGVDRIETFSLGFPERTFDESSHARLVAERYGTNHHEKVLGAGELLAALPRVLDYVDEPLADSSLLPTYLVCQHASEHVKVALGGDGGDELMFGYDTFLAHRLSRWMRLPRGLAQLGAELMDHMPNSATNLSLQFKVKRFVQGLGHREGLRDQLWMGSVPPWALEHILLPEHRELLSPERLYEPTLRHAAETAGASTVMDRLTYLYQRIYMQDDILTKVDRSSMAVSLEVRSPFLDRDLAELTNSLHWKQKCRGRETKVLLRRALASELPEQILQRKKKGFGSPIAGWLRDELRELLCDSLAPDRLRAQGLFDPRAVGAMVERHLAGRADLRKELWALLVFQQWHDRWLG